MDQQYAQHEQEGELEEYQQQNSFKKIEELENHGVNKTDIIKLKAGGYHTIEAVNCSMMEIKKYHASYWVLTVLLVLCLYRLHMDPCVNWSR